MLRKRQLLRSKGVNVEEDLSRAARTRRRELEKLFKSIKVSAMHRSTDKQLHREHYVGTGTRQKMFSDL